MLSKRYRKCVVLLASPSRASTKTTDFDRNFGVNDHFIIHTNFIINISLRGRVLLILHHASHVREVISIKTSFYFFLFFLCSLLQHHFRMTVYNCRQNKKFSLKLIHEFVADNDGLRRNVVVLCYQFRFQTN